jgi:hypothetical protein
MGRGRRRGRYGTGLLFDRGGEGKVDPCGMTPKKDKGNSKAKATADPCGMTTERARGEG